MSALRNNPYQTALKKRHRLERGAYRNFYQSTLREQRIRRWEDAAIKSIREANERNNLAQMLGIES